jgi:Homeodomain-like domain
MPAGRPSVIVGTLSTRAYQMYREGQTDYDIAAELEVARSTVREWRRRKGLRANGKWGRKYARWHYRLAAFVANGIGPKQAADILEKPLTTVLKAMERCARSEHG